MEHAPELVPYFAIGLFAGLRPDNELAGMDWRNIDFEHKTLHVEAASAKTRRERYVDMSANLIDWLQPYRQQSGRIAYNRQRFDLVREKAGLIPPRPHVGYYDLKRANGKMFKQKKYGPRKGDTIWKPDVMRHTFASYHLAAHNDANKTAAQLGHGAQLDMLFQHYRRAVRADQARSSGKSGARGDVRDCLTCNLTHTRNLIIEGDNFDALRLLKATHAGKIRVIYIDPPYNTGNKDWVYNDLEPEFRRLCADGRIYWGADGNGVPRLIRFLDEVDGLVPWTWWPHEEVGHTGEAVQEIKRWLERQTAFQTPKPTRLIERVLQIACGPNDLVLDFFAGSGTTAHAVHKLNAADGGKRRCILVSSTEATTEEPDKNLCRDVVRGPRAPRDRRLQDAGRRADSRPWRRLRLPARAARARRQPARHEPRRGLDRPPARALRHHRAIQERPIRVGRRSGHRRLLRPAFRQAPRRRPAQAGQAIGRRHHVLVATAGPETPRARGLCGAPPRFRDPHALVRIQAGSPCRMSRTALRDFQKGAVASGVQLFSACKTLLDVAADDPQGRAAVITQHGTLLLEAPTGSGKTLIAGHLVEEFSKVDDVVWFWFAPFRGLTGQTASALRGEFPGLRVRDLSEDRKAADNRTGDVFVTTWQTVATKVKDSRNVHKPGEKNLTVEELVEAMRAQKLRVGVVVDEAHHGFFGSGSETQAMKFFRESLRPEYTILVTATPDDEEMKRFEAVIKVAHHNRTTIGRAEPVEEGLIKEGVKCVAFYAQPGQEALVDYEDVALREGAALHRRIKAELKRLGVDLVPLMLVQVDSTAKSVERAKDKLLALGFSETQVAVHTAEEPDAGLLALANDEAREVLVFKMAVALGFDAPRATTLVSMRAARDEDFGVQLVGRILRVHRRLQGRARAKSLPEILRYGYVLLADARSQAGLDLAGQRINKLQTEYTKVSPTLAVVCIGGKLFVQKPGPGGQLELVPLPPPRQFLPPNRGFPPTTSSPSPGR
jgi:superfamily II DNA or RNA helicase